MSRFIWLILELIIWATLFTVLVMVMGIQHSH